MRKFIVALMVLALVSPIFASNYEVEEYESFDFISINVGGDFGWGSAKETVEDETFTTETTNMDIDLRFDGAIYFTRPSSSFQIGLGFNAGLGFPINTKVNGEKQTDFLMPVYGAITLETAFRFNPEAALEFRAGMGYRYTTLSTVHRGDDYLPLFGYVSSDHWELRQSELYALAGLGFRYSFTDDVSFRIGADATYSFFQALDMSLRRTYWDLTSYTVKSHTISVAEFKRFAVKPYIAIAVTM